MTTTLRCFLSLPLVLVLALGVAACSEDSPPAPTTPTPTTPASSEPEPDPDTLMPTLSSIQSLVFTPQCVMCHGDDVAEAGLNLAEGTSFASLVNVPSTQVALDLVEPNDAENSYLIHKLDGRDGIVGDRMPYDAEFLSEADIEVIKQWINDGAKDN